MLHRKKKAMEWPGKQANGHMTKSKSIMSLKSELHGHMKKAEA